MHQTTRHKLGFHRTQALAQALDDSLRPRYAVQQVRKEDLTRAEQVAFRRDALDLATRTLAAQGVTDQQQIFAYADQVYAYMTQSTSPGASVVPVTQVVRTTPPAVALTDRQIARQECVDAVVAKVVERVAYWADHVSYRTLPSSTAGADIKQSHARFIGVYTGLLNDFQPLVEQLKELTV